MRLLVLVVAIATASVSAVRPALAAGANIGLYTDTSGNTCSFSGNSPGAITAYVVFRPDAGGVNTVQFSAPVPACLGAVYVGETVTPGMMRFGNSQTGISIVMQGCYTQPASVLQINYMRSGSTELCCPYPILPDPTMAKIAASDCAFNEVTTTSVVSHFNADATCACVGNSPPLPPSTPSPADGTSGHSVRPQMTWFSQDFDDNIAGYDVYLGTSPSPPLVATGLTQPSYTPSTPLAELTQHYWRVVVRDAFGLEASGPVWTFTTRIANSPPFPPSNPVPASTAIEIPLTPTLQWQASDIDADPLTYDVYFGPSPTPPRVATNEAIKSFTPGTLQYGTTYYWRIVARDSGLETSGPTWNFTTRPANYPPDTPSAPIPANNATNQAVALALSWLGTDREGDPLVFDLYFGTSAAPPLVASGLTSAIHSVTSLAFSTKHYWRVVARDVLGHETTGPTWNFTTRPSNYPPDQPTSPSPANFATNQSQTPTLIWQGGDPDGDPVAYDVYFGTSAAPPLLAGNVLMNSYSPGFLIPLTTYYWRIVARDNRGAEISGPTWRFSTQSGNYPPTTPSNPTPADNATYQALTPTLRWQTSDPQQQQVSCDVYFGATTDPPLVATGVTNLSYGPLALNFTTTYYWRIRASDPLGVETWGPLWRFTTRPNAPPDPPFVSFPPPGSVNAEPNTEIVWGSGDPDRQPLTHDVYFGTEESPPLVATNIASRYYIPGTLALTTTYRWRIVVRDPFGLETSGPVWSFTTRSNHSPSPAYWPQPADNTAGGLSLTLSWGAYDIDQDPITNSVYLGTTNPPPLVATGLVGNSYQPATLLPATQYYWRVVTTDGLLSASSPIWTFAAVNYGDVVPDGQLTVADAACALRLYLQDTSCGGIGSWFSADVDCNGGATPRDARCIHKKVVDGSCTFCQETPSGDEPAVSAPTIELTHMSTSRDTLIARLAVSGIPSLSSFGFSIITSPSIRLVEARRRGVTSTFTALDVHEADPGFARVGAYSLTEESVVSAAEFVELRFDISHGIEGTLRLKAFVDDLLSGAQYTYTLGDMVGAGPIATGLVLHQNHPNPFNPQTTISYNLPAASERARVRLWILDISGRLVATLVDQAQSGGAHEVRWEGRDDRGQAASSGVYFYVLDVAGERRTKKLVLLK